MTTTVNLTYKSGNGVIQVAQDGHVVGTLAKQDDSVDVHIHGASYSNVTISEQGFVAPEPVVAETQAEPTPAETQGENT